MQVKQFDTYLKICSWVKDESFEWVMGTENSLGVILKTVCVCFPSYFFFGLSLMIFLYRFERSLDH